MTIYAFDGVWHLDHIVIVGVGGTGSAVSQQVARILWHRQTQGLTNPQLHLIDPDIVEAKNVGRQHFLPLDVGFHKAEITARRLSLLYGLPIIWANEVFDADKHLPSGSLVVGCVDNHLARQKLVAASEGQIYIDNGNAKTTGQVVIGSTSSREKLQQTIEQMERPSAYRRNDLFHPCYALPNIGLVYPELLQPEPESTAPDDLSCADLALADQQHVMVNDFVSLACCSTLYKLLYRQPLTTYQVRLDLHNFTTQNDLISPENFRQYLE